MVHLHLQDKMKHLELELDEEKNTGEMLTERINRSRDQVLYDKLFSLNITEYAVQSIEDAAFLIKHIYYISQNVKRYIFVNHLLNAPKVNVVKRLCRVD